MRHLAVSLLVVCSMCALTPNVTGQAEVDSLKDQYHEIALERIREVCLDCTDNKVILSRGRGNKFGDATVTYIDLRTKKQRQGKLSAYYFNNLLRFIESQGLFGMKDEYAMGWEDSTIVNLGVVSGDRHKTVKTRNEGEVPVQLWGIFMAIDGVVANAVWTGGKKASPQF